MFLKKFKCFCNCCFHPDHKEEVSEREEKGLAVLLSKMKTQEDLEDSQKQTTPPNSFLRVFWEFFVFFSFFFFFFGGSFFSFSYFSKQEIRRSVCILRIISYIISGILLNPDYLLEITYSYLPSASSQTD